MNVVRNVVLIWALVALALGFLVDLFVPDDAGWDDTNPVARGAIAGLLMLAAFLFVVWSLLEIANHL